VPSNLLKADWVTMESIRRLVNKLAIVKFANTDQNKEFKQPFPVGDTVRVKLPQRFTVRDGMSYSPQPLDRKYATVKVDQVCGIDFEWDGIEHALELERGEEIVRREYIEPAMDQIAQEIESRFAYYAYMHCPNTTGSLGTTPITLTPHHQARAKFVEYGCASGEKGMFISPQQNATLGPLLQALINPQKEISDLFTEGLMGNAAGFKWHESVSLYDHQGGTMTVGDCTVTTTVADGATSMTITSASAAVALKKGDIIGFTTPLAVNPGTRRSLGHAKCVNLTQDTTIAAGGGTGTLYWEEPLYGPGSQYQNVTALPAATNVLVLFPGATTPTGLHGIQSIALHRDAFAMVNVPMELPKSQEFAYSKRDPASGISVSIIKGFDINTRAMKTRIDVGPFGFGTLYAANCSVRVQSLL